MIRSTALLFLGGWLWLAAAPAGATEFIGAFADGSRFQGARLMNWPDAKGQPRVAAPGPDGKELDLGPVFDAKNPVSWLFNREAEAPSAPRPGVELFGGDRLPGQVLGFRYGSESPVERLPPHLVVKPDSEAVITPHTLLHVKTQAVRKVVWQPRHSDRYTPATVYLLDDQQISFRAVRWGTEGVTLLLKEGGTRNVAFRDMAELHLPRVDPWQNYREILAVLSPNCATRLMRIETSRGLAITGTMERSQISSGTHLFQPAWCLEPVGFGHQQLRWWRFFSAHEVPLSMIEPVRAEQHSPLGGARLWQADQNVKLQMLRSAGKLYGWGIGVQSTCELEYQLPNEVRSFRTVVGMDEQAARTGCGRARVFVNSTAEKPLWESKLLIGSEEVVVTDSLALTGPAQGQKSLILVADAPVPGRPAAADPLNIRSLVNWLEPRLELDPNRLRTDVLALLPQTIPAWQGWTATLTGAGRLSVPYYWDSRRTAEPRYRPGAAIQDGDLILSRQLEIGPKQSYLCLALAPLSGTPGGSIEVHVDGKLRALLTVPDRDPWFPAPRLLSLMKYRGRSVKLEVIQHPAKDGGAVEWRALDLIEFPELAPWRPLEIVEAQSSSPETSLSREENRTIFASRKNRSKAPAKETYTIVADTDLTEITALRLELLPDPRLPRNGPGRGQGGETLLSEFKVMAAPRGYRSGQAEALTLSADAGDNYQQTHPPAAAVDGRPETGWMPLPAGQAHAIVFKLERPIAFRSGVRLTIQMEQNTGQGFAAGRFRLLATNTAPPVPVARPGILLEPVGMKTLFAGGRDFVRLISSLEGATALEPSDTPSATASIKVTALQRTGGGALGEIRIRRVPMPGEFRYIQFAWKKSGGQAIGLQLAHDGSYDPQPGTGVPYRYHAGPGEPWRGKSVKIDDKAPADWVVVTRDLFADFGEFTLTGIGLNAFDGSQALFNGIRLGQTKEDFE